MLVVLKNVHVEDHGPHPRSPSSPGLRDARGQFVRYKEGPTRAWCLQVRSSPWNPCLTELTHELTRRSTRSKMSKDLCEILGTLAAGLSLRSGQ